MEPKKIAEILGAKIKGKFAAAGGYFGALASAAEQRLMMPNRSCIVTSLNGSLVIRNPDFLDANDSIRVMYEVRLKSKDELHEKQDMYYIKVSAALSREVSSDYPENAPKSGAMDFEDNFQTKLTVRKPVSEVPDVESYLKYELIQQIEKRMANLMKEDKE